MEESEVFLMKLEVKDLRKCFDQKEVLHGISFSTTSGKALGLLGRNGAGKTTTLRILMEVFRPDNGEILLDGKPFIASRYRIGYLPEERGLYPKKRVNEQLLYLAQLRGLSYTEAKNNTMKWLKRLEVDEYSDRRLETLSKGVQQKIQLAQALICDPEIVILDEPFSGLDPVNSKVLQDVVQDLVREGKLVIFSSHQMNYVEEFCEEIVILKEGRIVLQGNLNELAERFGSERLILSANNLRANQLEKLCFEKLSDTVSVYDRKNNSIILELLPGKTKKELICELINNEVDIERFGTYKPSLTEIFVLKAGDQNE